MSADLKMSAQKWSDELLEGLPESLLHWFACDCAERALMREKEEGRETDERSWKTIQTKRLWVLGEAASEEQAAARAAAWAAAGAAAWAAAEAERSWQISHLHYLIRAWEVCGERSPFLLDEGICPIEKG